MYIGASLFVPCDLLVIQMNEWVQKSGPHEKQNTAWRTIELSKQRNETNSIPEYFVLYPNFAFIWKKHFVSFAFHLDACPGIVTITHKRRHVFG